MCSALYPLGWCNDYMLYYILYLESKQELLFVDVVVKSFIAFGGVVPVIRGHPERCITQVMFYTDYLSGVKAPVS